MVTVLNTQIDSVLKDPRARKVNVPESDRTYFEILTDPESGDLIKQDVVESFRKTFAKPPPTQGQVVRGVSTDDPSYTPPETPIGGLQTGETVNPDGSINYSPLLEATQSAKFIVNLGSLVGGKMTAEGYFLPGPPKPNAPSFTFNLPPGMRPDEITADTFDKIMKVVRAKAPAEYQAAKNTNLHSLVEPRLSPGKGYLEYLLLRIYRALFSGDWIMCLVRLAPTPLVKI